VANDVAGYLGVDKGMVLDHFKKAVSDRNERAIARPANPLRHDERMLLIALLTQAEGRSEILEQMRMLETVETLPSRRIFQAIFALDGGGGRIGFEEVNARLEEADQNLLAQAVLNEDGEVSPEEIAASVRSMLRSEQQYLRLRLKARISENERAGKFDEALRLTMELQGMEKAARGGHA
jgi:hypothetical protein